MVKFLRSLSEKLVSKDPKFCVFLLVFAGYFFLRWYHLGYHDFWYDEVGTINLASYRNNWNAPLHYILMDFWMNLCGPSEFNLRFPSLIFSFLSVFFTYLLGKTLFNKKVGIIASFFIGLSPFHLWYAQEVRDYSMVLFFGTAASFLLVKAVRQEKWALWLLFILVSVLGFYTNYFYFFLFLAQTFCVLSVKKNRLGFKETVCLLIIAAFFLLLLPSFLNKFHTVEQGFWISKPQGRSLIITLENFILGYNGTPILYAISNVCVGVSFILALWVARFKEFRQPFLFCACLLFIPIMAVFFFSWFFFPVYLDRGLLLFSPYCYILLSLGVAMLNRGFRLFLLGILITIMLIGDYRYINDLMVQPFEHHMGTFIKKPMRPVVRFLRDNVRWGEDEIAFTNVSTMPGVSFYEKLFSVNMIGGRETDGKKDVQFYYFFDPELLEKIWKRPQQESKYCLPLTKIKQLPFKRLWVIASDWPRSGELDENSRSVKTWLDKHLKLEFSEEIDGLRVFRYVRDGF